jgi:hypothetical protein
LTTVHRTKEPILLDALTDLRAGLANSARVAELVRRTQRPLPRRDGVEPTILYPKKGSVQRENVVKLEQCDAGSAVRYSAYDTVEKSQDAPPWVTADELYQDAFFRDDCQATKELELRLGAQVMLLRNEINAADDPTIRTPGGGRLVNGSRGVIIGFDYACPLRTDERLGVHQAGAGAGEGGGGGGGGGRGSCGGSGVGVAWRGEKADEIRQALDDDDRHACEAIRSGLEFPSDPLPTPQPAQAIKVPRFEPPELWWEHLRAHSAAGSLRDDDLAMCPIYDGLAPAHHASELLRIRRDF